MHVFVVLNDYEYNFFTPHSLNINIGFVHFIFVREKIYKFIFSYGNEISFILITSMKLDTMLINYVSSLVLFYSFSFCKHVHKLKLSSSFFILSSLYYYNNY
jgi:hypothetical protein